MRRFWAFMLPCSQQVTSFISPETSTALTNRRRHSLNTRVSTTVTLIRCCPSLHHPEQMMCSAAVTRCYRTAIYLLPVAQSTLRLQATRSQGLTVRYSMYLVFGKPLSLTFKPCDGLPHRIWQSVLHVLRIPNIHHRIQTKLAVVGIQRLSRCPVEK